MSTMNQMTTAFVNSVQMVAEFHKTFGHPVGQEPSVSLPERRAAERLSYLTEELLEGWQGALAGDRIAVIDALADAIYFACGNLVECGVTGDAAYRKASLVFRSDENVERAARQIERACEGVGGWQRYIRHVFIGVISEFTGSYADECDESAPEPESKISLVEDSVALIAAFMSIMDEVMKADPLAVMEEVHRSNMSKLLPAELDSESACRVFMVNNGCKIDPIELKFERLDDMRWIAKHMGTDKVIKNPLYSEADLAAVA